MLSAASRKIPKISIFSLLISIVFKIYRLETRFLIKDYSKYKQE